MSEILDFAGIGAGPFNLAVAALLQGQACRSQFFEAKQQFDWHPGLMLPNAMMQTSYLKDLVTPVDPTNPYSFLNYLVAKRRFYDFMNAEQDAVSRQEYADYLGWVANKLPNLQFSSSVESVEDRGDHFLLQLPEGQVRSRRLCVGAGKRPYVPENCKHLLSPKCFHAIDIAKRNLNVAAKRVAVIGGGQTGAEIVLNLLNHHWGEPAEVSWVSRRSNFLPLDETPFSNDWFTPNYVACFRQWNTQQRAKLLREQKLASDGISPITLKALYQRFYQLTHLQKDGTRLGLYPGRCLEKLSHSGQYQLALQNNFNGDAELLNADMIILCTGLEECLPACLGDIGYLLARDEGGQLQLQDDFSARLPGQKQSRLYLLNMGRHSHGIAEPQLSLSAWRAACVVNSVLGKTLYDTGQATGFTHWQTPNLRKAQVA